MKRYIIVSFLTAVIPLTALASFNRPLSYGSSGADVEQLQELLMSQNCLSVQPTSYFGLLTLAGVKCFQAKYDISATGYFGNLSRIEANSIITAMTASSTAEQLAETGTTTPPQCPQGYSCTPVVPVQSQATSSASLQGIVSPQATSSYGSYINSLVSSGDNGSNYYSPGGAPVTYPAGSAPVLVPQPSIQQQQASLEQSYISSGDIILTPSNPTLVCNAYGSSCSTQEIPPTCPSGYTQGEVSGDASFGICVPPPPKPVVPTIPCANNYGGNLIYGNLINGQCVEDNF